MTRNQIEYWKLVESKRANRANEQHARNVLTYNYAVLNETHRANVARETETERSNRAVEMLTRQKNDRDWILSLRQLSETERANRVRERQAKDELAERKRANKANELIARANSITQRYVAETGRFQQAEIVRSNVAQELLSHERNELTRTSQEISQRLGLLTHGEQVRTHIANEQLQRYSNFTSRLAQKETARSNLANETERHRANVASEVIGLSNQGVSVLNETIGSVSRLGTSVINGEYKKGGALNGF